MVPGHGEADHGFGGGGQGFVVAGRAAMVLEMAEGSLDHPASGRHGETFGGEIAGDDPGVDAQGGGVLDEAREMATTGPGLADSGMLRANVAEQAGAGNGGPARSRR